MIILGIETSCDDTCVAIVEVKERSKPRKASSRGTVPSFEMLSNIVSSQTKIHKKYGGVVPSLAKRAHQENLVPVFEKALSEATLLKISNPEHQIRNPEAEQARYGAGKFKIPAYAKATAGRQNSKLKTLQKILEREPELLEQFLKIMPGIKKLEVDLVAVTYGPGLEPALWAGVNFARALSYWWEIPLVGVDHMEGHIAANFLPQKVSGEMINDQFSIFNNKEGKIMFPAICLAVSGGHTQLILIHAIRKYKLLGETVDDAAGEGFDKVARMLGLGFPGGPEIAKLAKGGNPKAFDFPRPMLHTKDYNFSFSGLKTAVLYTIKKLSGSPQSSAAGQADPAKISAGIKRDLAASFQQAVNDVLIAKTIRAAKEYEAKTVMLAGGVAANKQLRKQLGERITEQIPDTQYLIPDTNLATDNAAMIAAAAYFHRKNASLAKWKTLKANGNLKIK